MVRITDKSRFDLESCCKSFFLGAQGHMSHVLNYCVDVKQGAPWKGAA